MLTILYIHGFNSSGTTATADMLRQSFPEDRVIANSYPHYDPTTSILEIMKDVNTALSALTSQDELVVVGTSIGGFWAEIVHKLVGVKTVVINPARHPGTQLQKHLGKNVNYSTGITEYFTETDLESYKNFEKLLNVPLTKQFPFIGVLLTGDQIVNNTENVEEIKKFGEVRWIEGGGHRITQNEMGIITGIIREMENIVVGEMD